MTKKPRKADEPVRFTEVLPVRLTTEEIAAYADQAARTAADAMRRDSDRATRNKLEREQVEALESEVHSLLRKVREKREDRDVECEELKDFAGGSVVSVRLDTGEEVRRRPMSMEERQGALFEIGRGGEGVV